MCNESNAKPLLGCFPSEWAFFCVRYCGWFFAFHSILFFYLLIRKKSTSAAITNAMIVSINDSHAITAAPGSATDLRAAHHEISGALMRGIRIIVIVREEIERLSSTESLIYLIKNKLCELTVAGTIF